MHLFLALFLFGFVQSLNLTTYIVVFDDDITENELNIHMTAVLGNRLPTHVYQHVFKGYAAPLSPESLLEVQKHPNFRFFEEDQIVHASACLEAPAGSWGLSRISTKKPDLNGKYNYPASSGESVVAYIIDTGILVTHVDFGGRAKFGFKASSSWSNTDGNGHGTHVASTVAGKNYGVAKKVSEIVAVKVLGDDGSGTNAGVIAGVDWATGQHKTGKKKSVANMSLGGGFSTALNNAVNAAMEAGLFMVVAAGNNNGDACAGSPSSAKAVVTVGATDMGVNDVDIRSYFSNYGACVDIFAPGSDITAAWIGASNEAIRTISGTSMASPHVAGVVALLMIEHPNADTTTIKGLLTSTATPGAIEMQCPSGTTCSVSPNLLAWNGCLHS